MFVPEHYFSLDQTIALKTTWYHSDEVGVFSAWRKIWDTL